MLLKTQNAPVKRKNVNATGSVLSVGSIIQLLSVSVLSPVRKSENGT
jgi:hypothetical protein